MKKNKESSSLTLRFMYFLIFTEFFLLSFSIVCSNLFRFFLDWNCSKSICICLPDIRDAKGKYSYAISFLALPALLSLMYYVPNMQFPM